MGAPHPLLRGLWRAASAPGTAMEALGAPERGLRPLRDDAFEDLVAAPQLDSLLDPLDGEDAIDRALGRLRGAAGPLATPAATRPRPAGPVRDERDAHALPPAQAGAGMGRPAVATAATDAASAMAMNDARQSQPSVPRAAAAPGTLVHSRGTLPALSSGAARRAIAPSPPSAAARQVVALLLDGIRPPASALLAAIDLHDAGPREAAPAGATFEDRLLHVLRRVETTRRAAASPGLSPTPPDAFEPETTPQAPSGLRRLASRFAQRADAGVASSMSGPPPAVAMRAGAAPGLAADSATDAIAPILARMDGAAEDEAELSSRLARILRREARRQGVRDDGGAG